MLEDLSENILNEKLEELRRLKRKLNNQVINIDTDIIEIKLILESKKKKESLYKSDELELYDE